MESTEAKSPERGARPQRGEEVEVEIGSLAFGGAGVGRVDGFVVFVPETVPGDRVRIEITKRKRGHGEGRLLELLTPGPERIPAVANHPGAPWQILPYEAQLAAKQEQVEDALRRLGRLDGFELEPIVPAQEQWRYRNKLEFSFGESEEGTLELGFHAPGRWDLIEPLESCMLGSELSDRVRVAALDWFRTEGLTGQDREGGEGFLRNFVIREGKATGEMQARLVTSDGSFRTAEFVDALDAVAPGIGVWWTRHPHDGPDRVTGKHKHLAGPEKLSERLGDLRFEISPTAFFQTNSAMAQQLYGVAREFAAPQSGEVVFDLFCGIGTSGLATTEGSKAKLWGVEIVPEAVADAIESARANLVDDARFFAGDVRLALPELVERAGKPGLVVVDPPRSGLSKKIVRGIARSEPDRIVYISCNPTTFAPNAAQFAELGYRLARVRPVDMFPQTPHIECVSLLERV